MHFIFKNAFRNRRCTVLTVVSIAVSLFLIGTLETLLMALEEPLLPSESAYRVVVRHEVLPANILPIAYRERIRHVPGVERVTAAQWFGGAYKDLANSFAQFAVDADDLFDEYPEFKSKPEARAGFAPEETAVPTGVNLAERYGWQIGDRAFGSQSLFSIVRGHRPSLHSRPSNCSARIKSRTCRDACLQGLPVCEIHVTTRFPSR